MPLKSGMAAQLGVIDEVTYGVPPVVTRFYPFISEGVKQDIARVESKAIFAGRRVQDSTQWSSGSVSIGGPIQFELYEHTMGFWLRQLFGGYGVSGVGPYTQTYTPGDLTGKSFALQIGRPSVSAGLVLPFTYDGCKVAKGTLSAAVGENATLDVDIVGESEIRVRTVADGATTTTNPNITSATGLFGADDVGKPISGAGIPAATTILSVTSATAAVLSANATATATGVTFTIGVALAVASYGVLNPMSFVSASLSIASASVPVKSVALSIDNKLDADRRFIGSVLTAEPLEVERREYGFEFLPEFTDYTVYNRFVTAGTAALSWVIAFGTATLTVTSNVRFDGETPKVASSKIVENPMKAVPIGSTDAAAITVVTSNADAAY